PLSPACYPPTPSPTPLLHPPRHTMHRSAVPLLLLLLLGFAALQGAAQAACSQTRFRSVACLNRPDTTPYTTQVGFKQWGGGCVSWVVSDVCDVAAEAFDPTLTNVTCSNIKPVVGPQLHLRPLLPPAYADGISAPAGNTRKGPREISNLVGA